MEMNRFRHILGKMICFFCFGIASIFFTFIICPILILFIKDDKKLDLTIRNLVKKSFEALTNAAIFFKVISVDIKNKELLEFDKSMIICGNHPSFFDVIILFSLIPNIDCVVKSSLWKNPFIKHIISRLYISNSMKPEEILYECKNSLTKGRNLIIFPEGTRTTDPNNIKFHRSAAHISISSGHDILPVHIGVEDPGGFGKNRSFFDSPKDGVIKYVITFKKSIKVSLYAGNNESKESRRLTNELKAVIFSTGETDE